MPPAVGQTSRMLGGGNRVHSLRAHARCFRKVFATTTVENDDADVILRYACIKSAAGMDKTLVSCLGAVLFLCGVPKADK